MERRVSAKGEHLYEILGLQKSCNQDEIKKAYRRLALRYHPDKNPNDVEAESKFKDINHANAILSNETKRQIYDQYGSMGLQLAEQLGEDNFKAYLLVNSKWCKFLMIFTFCVTCCCCCLCCCCCFNWCCGKCKPQTPDDSYDYNDLQTGDNKDKNKRQEDISNNSDNDKGGNNPIIAQPSKSQSNTNQANSSNSAATSGGIALNNEKTRLVIGQPAPSSSTN